MPLIVAGIALALFIGFGTVMPIIQDMNANKTPIAEITAECKKEYKNTDEIAVSDFKVTAIHEDGAKTSLPSSEMELSRTTLIPVGDTTTVTLTWSQDTSIKCNVDVKVEREKIMGFQCGYPNVDNVVAVLYSNGELCFEGRGDTLVAEKGKYLWQNYDDKNKMPIRSVTFQSAVRPRVMDYWFSGIETLTYVDAIPDSVQSMKGTFQNCTGIETMADWTNCDSLLNISECYQGCTGLKYTIPVPASVSRGINAFNECILLQKTPNLSGATSLTLCGGMFSSCEKLVSITMPPNVTDMNSMFQGCRNLQVMPTIPDSVTNMEKAFSKCTALKTLSTVPEAVSNMSSCFEQCYYIEGTAVINASPEKMDKAFSNSCESTRLDLSGSSLILDAFANSCEYGNIMVNGQKPIPEITSLKAYENYKKNLEKMKEQERKEQEKQNQH